LSYKQFIASRFDAADETYHDAALVQQRAADQLINLCTQKFLTTPPCTILDVGCGTGYLSARLQEMYPNATFTLTDISPNMLKAARAHLKASSNILFIQGDLETDTFGNFDLVVSNFALQWSDDVYKSIYNLYAQTNVLAATCLLKNTFQEWGNVFSKQGLPSPVKDYPPQEDVEAYLKTLPYFHCETNAVEYVLDFHDARSVMQYLRLIGATASREIIPLGAFTVNV
jgi:malonyl-ACP O-methyltransferase BioC